MWRMRADKPERRLQCRKFMGIPPVAWRPRSPAASPSAASAAASAAAKPPGSAQQQEPAAAIAVPGGDGNPPPVLLAPRPAARTLPAATFDAVYLRLPHYASREDPVRKIAQTHAPTSRFATRYRGADKGSQLWKALRQQGSLAGPLQNSTAAPDGRAEDSSEASEPDDPSNSAAGPQNGMAADSGDTSSAQQQSSAFRMTSAVGLPPPAAAAGGGWAAAAVTAPTGMVQHGPDGAYYFEVPNTDQCAASPAPHLAEGAQVSCETTKLSHTAALWPLVVQPAAMCMLITLPRKSISIANGAADASWLTSTAGRTVRPHASMCLRWHLRSQTSRRSVAKHRWAGLELPPNRSAVATPGHICSNV